MEQIKVLQGCDIRKCWDGWIAIPPSCAVHKSGPPRFQLRLPSDSSSTVHNNYFSNSHKVGMLLEKNGVKPALFTHPAAT